MNFKMGLFMMENGNFIKCMVRVVISTDQEINGKESLLMVFMTQKLKSYLNCKKYRKKNKKKFQKAADNSFKNLMQNFKLVIKRLIKIIYFHFLQQTKKYNKYIKDSIQNLMINSLNNGVMPLLNSLMNQQT